MFEAHSVSELPLRVLISPGIASRLRRCGDGQRARGRDTMKTLLGLTTRTILIDAGTGARSRRVGKLGTREKDVTLDVALRLKSKLEMSGQYQSCSCAETKSLSRCGERAYTPMP
jgi:N-acetylmuramoyl-L-alanine amidase